MPIPLTEVKAGPAVPARRHPKMEALGTLPCETDQAKPDRISRLARSTILSKIHAADPPGRGLGIETLTVTPGALELDCATPARVQSAWQAIWRELFKIIPTYRCRSSRFAQRSISKSNQKTAAQKALKPLRLAGKFPGSCNGFVLCGIPYRGLRGSISPSPANQLPTSPNGQAKRPPGGSTAQIPTFQE